MLSHTFSIHKFMIQNVYMDRDWKIFKLKTNKTFNKLKNECEFIQLQTDCTN